MRKLPFIVMLVLALAACAKHDDLPAPVQVTDPPVPTNLVVQTADNLTYHVSWDIDDPGSIVTYYRVYSQLGATQPEFADTTTSTSVEVIMPLPVPGMVFCVSSVTEENVESRLACAGAE